jgi:anticodon-binding protein
MESEFSSALPSATPLAPSEFTAADIEAILRERGWMGEGQSRAQSEAIRGWIERAAALLGPHAVDRGALADLLGLIFHYDAAELLRKAASQEVMMRTGAREVVRELANRVLDGDEIDSDRFQEVIDAMKEAVPYRSRALFHPIRLALAGRAGEGKLDRVILLLDAAAKIEFAAPVKGMRRRMLEFCAALD